MTMDGREMGKGAGMMKTIRNTQDLATAFLDLHFPQDWARQEILGEEEVDGVRQPMGIYGVQTAAVAKLTEELQNFIAEVLATILNAGSEREAVNENDKLYDALLEEVTGWVVPEDQEAEKGD